MTTAHHPLCEYWHDQYPHECTCGMTRPKAVWFDKIVAEDTERRAISFYADDGGTPDAWHAVDHQVRHFYRLMACRGAT